MDFDLVLVFFSTLLVNRYNIIMCFDFFYRLFMEYPGLLTRVTPGIFYFMMSRIIIISGVSKKSTSIGRTLFKVMWVF